MQDKDKIDKAINNIFASFDNEDEKTDLRYKKISQLLIKYSKYDIKDPYFFNRIVKRRLDKSLIKLINSINLSIAIHDKFNNLLFIYTNYDFMYSNIETLIAERDAENCGVKTKHILDTYRGYLEKAYIPRLTSARPNFGTYKEWFAFCDGLYKLHIGIPKDYMVAYKILLDAPTLDLGQF